MTAVSPEISVYLDLRAFGAGWYENIQLPNSDFAVYVVQMTYTSWSNSSHTRINAFIPILDIVWDKRQSLNHFFVKSWGSNLILTPSMTFITTDFVMDYKIKESIASS